MDKEHEERMKQLQSEYETIQQHIDASEGLRVAKKIMALRGSIAIFAGNYDQLMRGLDEISRPELLISVFSQVDQRLFEHLSNEVTRLLHNFLGGAGTLVDHTRIFARDMFADSSFMAEYEEKVKQTFSESPIRQFVQRLRNYMLHYALPINTVGLRIERIDEGKRIETDSSLSLNASKLREWDGWTAPSRKYLNSFDDRLEIRPMADEYESVVRSFYEWFDPRFSEIYRDPVEELRALETRSVEIEQEIAELIGSLPPEQA